MTERIFETEPKKSSCHAVILSCDRVKDGWEVILNKTVFFPESGGQLCDVGTIDDVKVLHVSERGEDIVHLCQEKLEIGRMVVVEIDSGVRLDHSQQHTAEHILSHALWKLFGAKNIGFHMTEEVVTIDLNIELTAEQCFQAEDFANTQIYQDKPVHIIYRDREDLDDLDVRKVTDKVQGRLRIVVVEDGDVCTCCGTHTDTTGCVGLIRILKVERHRGGTRLEFIAGRKALLDARWRTEILRKLVNKLSCSPDRLPESVESLKSELKDCSVKLKTTAAKLMKYYAAEALESAEVIKGVKCVFVPAEVNAAEAKMLLKHLLVQAPVIAGVFYINGDRLEYLIGASEGTTVSCRDIANIANELINGKGGGSDTLVQGAGKKTQGLRELAYMVEKEVCKLV